MNSGAFGYRRMSSTYRVPLAPAPSMPIVRLVTLLRFPPTVDRSMFQGSHAGLAMSVAPPLYEHLGVVDLQVQLPGVAGCALDEEREALDAVGRPVLRRIEGQHGFGEGERGRVVVEQGHRLLAAVDDRLLGERGVEMADCRAAALVGIAVDPELVDPVALIVGVALEVLDDLILLRREAPHGALIPCRTPWPR